MRKKLPLFMVFLLLFPVIFAAKIQAQTVATQPHFSVILNQVRGKSCCGEGNLATLTKQIQLMSQLRLPMTFAVRYDALHDLDMVKALKLAQKDGAEIGGLLEVTPDLAKAAGVTYRDVPQNWYLAQNVFLIGYQPSDRQKLIDTFMVAYHQNFGAYPQTTVAWMIDTPSLHYLHDQYQVQAHELTKEQWITDSYTLDGGPEHLPYLPSENWAMIPAASSSSAMPLILRQTISDPVMNLGDRTGSYTAQPNDYQRQNRHFSYFTTLFDQAHQQPADDYTFAMLGIENSMPADVLKEFSAQLSYVADWQKKNSSLNQVVTAAQFTNWWHQSQQTVPLLTTYHGSQFETAGSEAWWINAQKYRLRLRWDNHRLFVSDIRVYDPLFTDPYATQQAQNQGYWVVPFLLNGSRFWLTGRSQLWNLPIQDYLSQRLSIYSQPSQWLLVDFTNQSNIELKLTQDGQQLLFKNHDQLLAEFRSTDFSLLSPTYQDVSPDLKNVIQRLPNTINWLSRAGQVVWQLAIAQDQTNSSLQLFQPKFLGSTADWKQQLLERYPYLLPEFRLTVADPQLTQLQVINRYALAGAQPVKLLFSQRDAYGYPLQQQQLPTVTTSPEIAVINPEPIADATTSSVINLIQNRPSKVNVNVSAGKFNKQVTVYFAPDCRQAVTYCLTHPVQAWWYIRNWWGDKVGVKEQVGSASQ